MWTGLDPEIAAVLERASQVVQPDISRMAPVEAARMMRAARRPIVVPERLAARTENLVVPTPAGGVPVWVYFPHGAAKGAVVNIHGGGFVMGELASDDYLCHHIACAADCVVVSVDYRLAPEHPYPAALEDCLAVVAWTRSKGGEFGFDPERLALCGTSSGGALSAACALVLRDREDFTPIFQLLIYPVCDGGCDTPAFSQIPQHFPLNRSRMLWFWDQYAPDPQVRAEPYASPLRAAHFTGLPPTHVVTGEYDPLRDEGEAYAARLNAAGVPATATQYPGTTHGFLTSVPNAAVTRQAMDEIAKVMARAMSGA